MRSNRGTRLIDRNMTPKRQLRRILGLGFGLAFGFGTMIGVGILRLPGMVAAAAGDPVTIILCWCVGGVYALMGAVSVSELAALYPETGGLRVYPRHAFGERAGFVVGWIDWLAVLATTAYAAVSAADFAARLWPALAERERTVALAVVAMFGTMHAIGLRMGRSITAVVSTTIGLLFLALIVGCFMATPLASVARSAVPKIHGQTHWVVAFLSIVPAMRAIVTAYDGWYAPVYTAEECVDASRTLPRAIIGVAAAVTCLYVAINAAFLRVLPVPVLATSALPAADAARIVLPYGSETLMTILSLLIMLSLVNGQAIMGPRILLSLARDGWVPPKLAEIGVGGTPQPALAATMIGAGLVIVTGTFDEIIALFAVLIVLNYVAVFLSVFVLRYRLPNATRPFKAWGYPVTTAIVLVGSVGFLVAAIIEDWHSGVTAVVFLSLCIPAYRLAGKSRRAPASKAVPEVT